MDTRDIKDELVELSPAQQAEMEERCEQDESHQHYPFGRADNQVAVTVPASILAPEKSWGMHRHNNTFRIFHNYAIDVKVKLGGFLKFWKLNTAETFHISRGQGCL